MKRYIFLILIVLLVFTGCSNEKVSNDTLENKETVKLIVTKDFGNSIIFSEDINLKHNFSILELMEENLEVNTAYNGGFINSINGFQSGFTNKKNREKKDWFYYVNGTLSQVGSLHYIPKNNDVIQWDYHDWSRKYASSLIGSFPNEFTNGYGDNVQETEIAYYKEYQDEVDLITEFLNNRNVVIENYYDLESYDIKSTDKNIVIFGLWEDIKSKEFISGLMKKSNKIGMFFEIDETIKLTNYKNETVVEEDSGCIITSFIRDYSSMSKIFLITGNNKESITKGVNLLIKDTEKFEGLFSVLVTPKGKIINIPHEKEAIDND